MSHFHKDIKIQGIFQNPNTRSSPKLTTGTNGVPCINAYLTKPLCFVTIVVSFA